MRVPPPSGHTNERGGGPPLAAATNSDKAGQPRGSPAKRISHTAKLGDPVRLCAGSVPKRAGCARHRAGALALRSLEVRARAVPTRCYRSSRSRENRDRGLRPASIAKIKGKAPRDLVEAERLNIAKRGAWGLPPRASPSPTAPRPDKRRRLRAEGTRTGPRGSAPSRGPGHGGRPATSSGAKEQPSGGRVARKIRSSTRGCLRLRPHTTLQALSSRTDAA